MTRYPQLPRERPSDLLHRPLPEHGYEVVPHGLLEIAIPIRIDRRTKSLVGGRMADAARAAAVAVADRVDRAEGRSGQSHHHCRVLAHRVGDALATSNPSGDKLEGVVSVDLR